MNDALHVINMVKDKSQGKMKGCTCADGSPGQEYILY